MAGLVTSCNEQITLYEKVFIESGMVHFKEDFSKKGAKMVRFWYYHSYYKRYQVEVATLELSVAGVLGQGLVVVEVSATALPQRSTTLTCEVPLSGRGAGRQVRLKRPP